MFSALFTPKLSEWNDLIENLLLQAETAPVNIHYHTGRGCADSLFQKEAMDQTADKLTEEKRSDHHRIRNESKSDSAENSHNYDKEHSQVNGKHPLL
jgi:hypothetical protein